MGKFSHTRAIFGATTTATPQSAGSSGDFVIGSRRETVDFDDFDICYEFKIISQDALTFVDLDIKSSTLTVASGTPIIDGGEGKDFEGVSFPQALYFGVIAWELEDSQSNYALITSDEFTVPPKIPTGRIESSGSALFNISPTPFSVVGSPTVRIALNTTGQVFKGTIFAKSS